MRTLSLFLTTATLFAGLRSAPYFEPNQGQFAPEVRFVVQEANYKAWITTDSLFVQSTGVGKTAARIRFGNGFPGTAVGIEKQPGVSSYFLTANTAKWVRDVPAYGKVRLENIRTGIDVVFYTTGSGDVEYDLIVHPGADVSQMQIEFDPELHPTQSGKRGDVLLTLPGGGGELRHEIPLVHQKGKPVPYTARLDGTSLRFGIGAYDQNETLVIDPRLTYVTTLGSSGNYVGPTGLAADSQGAVYASGTTNDPTFPTLNGGGSLVRATGQDCYITKLNPAPVEGTFATRVYSVFFGGPGDDTCPAIAVDSNGAAYVAGFIYGTDTTIPLVAAAHTTATQHFAIKLSAGPSPTLVYSTYLPVGTGGGLPRIAVDGAGAAHIALGAAFGTQLIRSLQSWAGQSDVYVIKIAAAPASGVYGFEYATFFGGSEAESVSDVAVDASGGVYIGGTTQSVNLPAVRGFQLAPSNQQSIHGYLAKLNPPVGGGNVTIEYATYLNTFQIDSIAVDSDRNLYFAGQRNNMATVNGIAGASGVGYIGKVSGTQAGSNYPLLFGTPYGGNFDFQKIFLKAAATGGVVTMAANGSRNFSLTGEFPAVDVMEDPALGGLVMARIDTVARSIVYSTPVPGGGGILQALALDPGGTAYLMVRASRLEPLYGDPAPVDAQTTHAVLRVSTTPTPASVIVTSNPSLLEFSVSGANCGAGTYRTPKSFYWPAGRTCTVTFADQLDGAAVQRVFQRWENSSTSGARTITAGASPATIEGTFTPRYGLRVTASGCCGTVSPAHSDYTFYAPGTVVPITATPSAGSTFVRWQTTSITLPNPLSPTISVTMNLGINLEAIFAESPSSGATALQFVPVTPCRVADTRLAPGTFGQPAVAAGVERSFPVPQSACGIPADAKAYSLNVTVVPRQTLGYLTIWPTGAAQPTVSTLNAVDGRIKANAAIVPAGTNGGVSVFVNNTADVVLDINGYFVPQRSDSLMFYPVTPCRIIDTRLAQGPLGGPALRAGITRSIPIRSSSCGIPAAAKAYSLNTTVVPPGGAPVGYLSVWPTGQTQPVVSTLNAVTGTIVANAALVPAGSDSAGSIDVFANADTDLLVDVNGYFAPPGTGGLHFYPLNPCRLYDSRVGGGPFQIPEPWGTGIASARVMPILDLAPCGVSPVSKAFSLNLTVLPVSSLGYVTMWPDNGSGMPVVSTLNAVDGAITSNAALIPGSDFQKIVIFPSAATNVILDINGYFAQ